MTPGNTNKDFLDGYIAERLQPDEVTRETRDERWPYPFPKTVLGQVDQTVTPEKLGYM
jgi:hypothetical protein